MFVKEQLTSVHLDQHSCKARRAKNTLKGLYRRAKHELAPSGELEKKLVSIARQMNRDTTRKALHTSIAPALQRP